MTSNVLSVAFRFPRRSPPHPPAVDLQTDSVVGDLTAIGFEFIELVDVPVKSPISGQTKGQSVRLYVENDAMYLADSYLHLEKIAANRPSPCEHNTFLGDGVLQLQAVIVQSNVTLRIIYCPGLNESSLSITDIHVRLRDYFDTWRELAKSLRTGVGASE